VTGLGVCLIPDSPVDPLDSEPLNPDPLDLAPLDPVPHPPRPRRRTP